MSNEMTRDEMLALLTKLQADNNALRQAAARPAKVTLKVSEKGALSLYGLGRWPVTLYKSQWTTLLGHTKAIEAFMADNAHTLADKPAA